MDLEKEIHTETAALNKAMCSFWEFWKGRGDVEVEQLTGDELGVSDDKLMLEFVLAQMVHFVYGDTPSTHRFILTKGENRDIITELVLGINS